MQVNKVVLGLVIAGSIALGGILPVTYNSRSSHPLAIGALTSSASRLDSNCPQSIPPALGAANLYIMGSGTIDPVLTAMNYAHSLCSPVQQSAE